MCGIAGFVDARPYCASKEAEQRIARMLDSMPWRGPDAKGVWNSEKAVLGHLRLSIIDLSTAANQPMTDVVGNTIVFNGEIYNYRELRSELSSSYDFRTQSDTEVILAAYVKWGRECVQHFNGEWAFAIHDAKAKELFLSRDRFGIKPLYYAKTGSRFYFASEIRALLAAGVPAETSVQKIASFLKYRQIEQRYETLLNGIFPLEPGNNMILDLDTGEFSKEVYYAGENLFQAEIPDDEASAAESFGFLLQDAVRLRLHADVPVEVLLSGGLDSSAIAALAVNACPTSVSTLSYVSPGSQHDESHYSNMVANALGTRHHRVQSEGDSFFDVFDAVIKAQDFPTYSEKHVARYLLYKQASERATVVIEGQGGDEVFGGYGRMYQIYRDHYEKRTGERLVMQTHPKGAKSTLSDFEELSAEARASVRPFSKNVDVLVADEPYEARQYLVLRNNLLALLHTGDRLQMYHSIEGRYPLLDHRVVEFGLSMPVHYKMQKYDKHLLRKYLERNNMLPLAVIYRTDKKGFSTKLEEFLLQSDVARRIFFSCFNNGCQQFPNLFNIGGLKKLLDEQYESGINNCRRLLAVYALMKYMEWNSVKVV